MDTILRLEQVNKSYGNGRQALQDISFTVKKGEFVSVIGPSGAGKSTLLRSINQLQQISSGDVWIGEDDIVKARGKKLREIRRRIGMVFQNYNLVYRSSVLQNVLHGRLGYMSTLDGVLSRYCEEDKRKAIDLLEELQMGAFMYSKAEDLSGGQKQRVGIARAFIQDLDILLCDEPIASLDPSSAKVIMEMIRKMAVKRGIACLVNLHQIDAAKQYSTRIIGLRQGQMVFDGTPEQLTDEMIEKIYGTPVEQLMLKEAETDASAGCL